MWLDRPKSFPFIFLKAPSSSLHCTLLRTKIVESGSSSMKSSGLITQFGFCSKLHFSIYEIFSTFYVYETFHEIWFRSFYCFLKLLQSCNLHICRRTLPDRPVVFDCQFLWVWRNSNSSLSSENIPAPDDLFYRSSCT